MTTENDTIPIHDYSAYADPTSPEGDLGTLTNLAEQARLAEQEVERLQRELKKAQKDLGTLVEVQIPELMDKVGMEKFSTRNGLNISIQEAIRASMGTDDKKEANLRWLQENGHEAIIKTAVVVPFGRSEEDRTRARELANRITVEMGYEATFERKVEPSTLSALARELLEEGRPFPEEQFGVYRQRKAKIT